MIPEENVFDRFLARKNCREKIRSLWNNWAPTKMFVRPFSERRKSLETFIFYSESIRTHGHRSEQNTIQNTEIRDQKPFKFVEPNVFSTYSMISSKLKNKTCSVETQPKGNRLLHRLVLNAPSAKREKCRLSEEKNLQIDEGKKQKSSPTTCFSSFFSPRP